MSLSQGNRIVAGHASHQSHHVRLLMEGSPLFLWFQLARFNLALSQKMDETSAPDKATAEPLAVTAPLADLVPKKVFTVIRATALQNKLLRDAFKETHVTTPARLEQLEKETGL